MKELVPTTLILCGTFLIALPIIDGMMGVALVSKTMIALGKSADLSKDQSPFLKYLVIVIGVAMVAVGSAGRFRQTA